jgi:cell division GTPase FtsZ
MAARESSSQPGTVAVVGLGEAGAKITGDLMRLGLSVVG